MSIICRTARDFPKGLHKSVITESDAWGAEYKAAVVWRSRHIRDNGDGNWYGHAMWPADHCPVELRRSVVDGRVFISENHDRVTGYNDLVLHPRRVEDRDNIGPGEYWTDWHH